MIRKVLIANRGEIALRIMRTCRELGITTVAVHSTADAESMHVRMADESVCIGPPSPQESYLNISSLLSAAEISQAEAIHPGYGFLSESYEFASIVEEHGLKFIGPRPEHIRDMGDKIIAKATAKKLGLPIVPGTDCPNGISRQEIEKRALTVGFPLIIKAAGGGGGRGMQVANSLEEVYDKVVLCKSEAAAAFNNDSVYFEKYLLNPRHIEVQIVGDGKGQVLHFYERDCSVQRRHQKLIEEAPAAILTEEMRNDICSTTSNALKKMCFRGAGTVEYLFENNEFYFIEMNTRIQVEHGVSELITGHDIVAHQLSVASGDKNICNQNDISYFGHAIEARINAEDPWTFVPSAGTISSYHPAGGPGVRIDSAVFAGVKIPPFYDSLIVKLITFAESRGKTISRMKRALHETVIEGVNVNIPLIQKMMDNKSFNENDIDVHWLERELPNIIPLSG